ncbi:MAG: hypothetical protein J6I40_07820, partial [Mailhella sp.]|nr:hypothetical protein [Mailhella sp.]
AAGLEGIACESFSYDGYQVVRGEFFSHLFEPSVTFSDCKFYVNTTCLAKMPQVEYVQILVNPETRKLAVRPSSEDAKDAFLWCSSRNGKRKPKQIICRIFFAKIMELMGWNPEYRYKLLGKLIQCGGEHLYLFDLTATEVYQRAIASGGKARTSRTPTFPTEWQNQFGLPVEEHKKQLQINIFNGYTVFGLTDRKKHAVREATGEEKDEAGSGSPADVH